MSGEDEEKWGDWASGPEQADTSESSERSESSGLSERSETTENVRKASNIKQEWEGVYVYLPPDGLASRVDEEYERLRYECKRDGGVSIQKDRHYKPVVVVDGLQAVEELLVVELLSVGFSCCSPRCLSIWWESV